MSFPPSFFRVADAGDEVSKKLVVNFAALGMILHGQSKRIIAQPDLLDNVVGRAPGFDFEPSAEAINRLVMGAVHFLESMSRPSIGS